MKPGENRQVILNDKERKKKFCQDSPQILTIWHSSLRFSPRKTHARSDPILDNGRIVIKFSCPCYLPHRFSAQNIILQVSHARNVAVPNELEEPTGYARRRLHKSEEDNLRKVSAGGLTKPTNHFHLIFFSYHGYSSGEGGVNTKPMHPSERTWVTRKCGGLWLFRWIS